MRSQATSSKSATKNWVKTAAKSLMRRTLAWKHSIQLQRRYGLTSFMQNDGLMRIPFPLASAIIEDPQPVQKKLGRSVSFDPNVKVYKSQLSLTEEDIVSGWLQPRERMEIKSHIRETILMIKQGCTIDERTHCGRGLEKLTDPQTNKDSRRKVARAVIVEQTIQSTESSATDPELIALASLEHSATDKEKGHLQGLIDQQESLKCFQIYPDQETKWLQATRVSDCIITPDCLAPILRAL